jgi:hypothetical protein
MKIPCHQRVVVFARRFSTGLSTFSVNNRVFAHAVPVGDGSGNHHEGILTKKIAVCAGRII